MNSGKREIALVLWVALIGVFIAAAVVLAPWHVAEALSVPVGEFVPASPGQ